MIKVILSGLGLYNYEGQEKETRILSKGAFSWNPDSADLLNISMLEFLIKFSLDFTANLLLNSMPYISPDLIISEIRARTYPEPEPSSRIL